MAPSAAEAWANIVRIFKRSPWTFYNFLVWPHPLLRFIVGWPFYQDQNKEGNRLFSYLIWTSFNLTSNPVEVEIRGTWAARLGPYLWLAFLFLSLDLVIFPFIPKLKSKGRDALPLSQAPPFKVIIIALVSVSNVLLSVGVQYLIAIIFRRVLLLPYGAFRISVRIPPRMEIIRGVARALLARYSLQYTIHRWVFHEWSSPFRKWHLAWQHSIKTPFALVAAYDHPINYLVMFFGSVYIPAAILKLDICTWYYLLIWVGLEDALLFSGCSIAGIGNAWTMVSRRQDAHFESLKGNYGRWGIEDLIMGTLLPEKRVAVVVDEKKKDAVEKNPVVEMDGDKKSLENSQVKTSGKSQGKGKAHNRRKSAHLK